MVTPAPAPEHRTISFGAFQSNTRENTVVDTLHTDRLTLTSLVDADAPVIAAYLNDKEVRHHYGKVLIPGIGPIDSYTPEHARMFIEHARRQSAERTGMRWGIRRMDDLVGHIDLEIVPEHERAAVKIILAPEHRAQGYGRETVERVVDYSFMDVGLNRLEAFIYAENKPSHGLFIKAGFTPESQHPGRSVVEGKPRTEIMYRLMRTEWEQNKAGETSR